MNTLLEEMFKRLNISLKEVFKHLTLQTSFPTQIEVPASRTDGQSVIGVVTSAPPVSICINLHRLVSTHKIGVHKWFLVVPCTPGSVDEL